MNDFRVINDRKWTRQQKCEGQKKKKWRQLWEKARAEFWTWTDATFFCQSRGEEITTPRLNENRLNCHRQSCWNQETEWVRWVETFTLTIDHEICKKKVEDHSELVTMTNYEFHCNKNAIVLFVICRSFVRRRGYWFTNENLVCGGSVDVRNLQHLFPPKYPSCGK